MSFLREIGLICLLLGLCTWSTPRAALGASEELIKAASKEGNLLVYGTTQIDHMQSLIKQFSQKYPAIKGNYLRQGTTAVYERILREQRAGLFAADAYGGIGGLQAWLLAQKGALAPYASPERAAISNNLKDKEGYWTAAYTVSFVTAFDTRAIKRAEAPRGYDDFLSPKWKGKMWLNEDDIEWYATMFEIMGKERGTQFMRRLAQQDLRYGRDPSLAIELLCAGEFPLMIGIHFHHTERLKQKGCPVDWVVTEPGYNRPPIAIALAKNAPHPAAGKLFIDYLLSREGQRAIQTITLRYPVRSDIELSGELLKLKGIRFWDSNWDAIFHNIDAHQKSFRQTFNLS
jgi:iron(III) transport system substrate-binding protein